jgi:hypothetical protein
MRKKGIAVEGGPEPIHVASVNATGNPAEIGIADLVLVVKIRHLVPPCGGSLPTVAVFKILVPDA